ncbi:hypothetical protein BGZ83_005889 [Gryganskiella cystojenkinii]|nr:hypothetical protein BGZ83_005889 [Gryganskiella cystojenkinii]
MQSMDKHLYRQFVIAQRRNLRLIRGSFRRHGRRNLFAILVSFFVLLTLLSRLGQRFNSVEQRWLKLQEYVGPGILGGAPDFATKQDRLAKIKVKLCSADGKLCSDWGREQIWDSKELGRDEAWLTPGRIQIPIGVKAVLNMKDGGQFVLPFGQHLCSDQRLPCQDIVSMTVEESILSAVDAIEQACVADDWATQPEIVHTIGPKRHAQERDVTMIAQYSISRLDRFEKAILAWSGPVSAVIYLPDHNDVQELKKYFSGNGKAKIYQAVTLTLIKPQYSLGTHSRYPINQLRNIGIVTAETDYIYVMDADFVPTTKLYNFALTTIIPRLEQSSYPTAYVVPCVAIKEDYSGRYPDSIKELQPLMKSGVAYITDPRAGHGPTQTRLFMNPPLFGHSVAFEVCFESQWEPYYIVRRDKPHPYYDERFKNQGGDKQSHALLMNALGFKFLVLRDHFMYHMDHPKLKWTGDGLDQAKQKDFTLFADYTPALENIFDNFDCLLLVYILSRRDPPYIVQLSTHIDTMKLFSRKILLAILSASSVLSLPVDLTNITTTTASGTPGEKDPVLSGSGPPLANAPLRVLTNNVFFLPEFINWGQRTRARLIASADYIRHNDVVVVEECFESVPCGILREGLKAEYPYQTPTLGSTLNGWNSTSGSYSSLSFANGGVVIFSKWPIKEKHQFIYKDGCGNDWFSNKGFTYAVLDYNGTNIHVFGTHMQSDDSRCQQGQAATCRALAMDAWRSFVKSRNIPTEELIVFAGDFNVKRDTTEFNTTLLVPRPTALTTQLSGGKSKDSNTSTSTNTDNNRGGGFSAEPILLHAPDVYQGHEYTWDGFDNSIAHAHVDEQKDRNYIDFVFVVESKNRPARFQSVVQTVLNVHSPNFTIAGQVYDDFSDHFPVLATITMNKEPIVNNNITTPVPAAPATVHVR